MWHGQLLVIIPPESMMTPDTYLQLTKEVKRFKWTDEAEKAFKDMKELLISPPVLKALTPDGLFWLKSDISFEGVGRHFISKARI